MSLAKMQKALKETKALFEKIESKDAIKRTGWKDEFLEIISTPSNKKVVPDKKSVYCGLFNDGSIKIGVSKSPKQRLKTISRSSGKNIIDCFVSEELTNFLNIEKRTLLKFSSCRMNGEWLSDKANFMQVVECIKGMIK